MALQPHTIEQFGGLQLTRDPLDVGSGAAISISNVDLDRPGMFRTRPGRAFHTANDTSTFSDAPYRAVYAPFQNQVLVANSSILGASAFAAYSTVGSTVTTATLTADTGPPVDMAVFGDSSSSRPYAIGLNGIQRWSGSAFTTINALTTPRGGYLASWAPQARMVAAYCAINGGPRDSRVHFSNAGTSETWTANDFVDVDPGSGENIIGIQAIGNSVIVFKNTKAFIFYGVSTDADGLPIFGYRAVSLGDWLPYVTGTIATSGRFGSDGDFVYYVASRGVYRIGEGGTPVLLSGDISPVFEDSATYGTFTFATATADRVYVGGTTKTLVLEKSTGQWSIYSFSSQAILPAPIPAPRETWMMCSSRLVELDTATTTDLGSAIAWSYTSGRYALGDPGRVAVTLDSSVVGSGTVAMSVTTDLYGTLAGPGATLGTAPATAEGWPMTDQEGTWFQHTLSGTGAAAVNRLTHHISFVKPAGVR